MSMTSIAKSITNLIRRGSFRVQKRAPELLIITGVVGGVGAAVMACKATTKADDVFSYYHDEMDRVEACESDHSLSESGEYTDEDAQKDRAIIYIHTAGKFVKLYGPSVLVGITSIACIFASNAIMRKRIVAMTAAYSALDGAFSEYRSRVVEKYGEDVDKEMRYGTKAKKITQTVVNEDGTESKIKVVDHTYSGGLSCYAAPFKEYTDDAKGNRIRNVYYDMDPNFNEAYIRSREQYATDHLIAYGHVFLNDVYKILGIPPTKAGQIVGWSLENGDTYVSFASYNKHGLNDPLIHDEDGDFVLDFNVSGNIIDQFKEI